MKPSFVQSIQKASLMFMAGTFLVSGLGIFKSLFIARYYGTSAELDAYFLAMAPLRLFSGIIIGAVQVTIIPQYIKLLSHKQQEHALRIFGTLLSYILLLVLVGFLVIWWKNDTLAGYLGIGFDSSLVSFTASLLPLVMLLLLLTVGSDVGLCLFQAHRQFLLAAFLPVINAICSVWFLVQFHELGVITLVYGLLFGMAFQNGVIWLASRKFFPRTFRWLSPRHPDIQQAARLMAPLILGASFGHVNIVIDQIMASSLPEGSISALNYAVKMHSTITQICIMAVSQAVLPFFSKHVAEQDWGGLKITFKHTAVRMLLLLVPISIGVLFWGKSFIKMVFQRGAFTSSSTTASASAWVAYSLGLPVQGVGILVARVYNALQENATLMYVSIMSMVLNILLNWIFMKFWGHVGIALSTSGVYIGATGILSIILYKKIKRLERGANL